MKRINWETANDIRLVKLTGEDADRAKIAKVFQTTEDAVSKRLDRLRQKYGFKTIAALVYHFCQNKLIKTLIISLFLFSCTPIQHGYRTPVKWEFKPKELKYILKQVRVGDTLVNLDNCKQWIVEEIKHRHE